MIIEQVCPVCNGNGNVSGGFYTHAGDCNTWASDHIMETCQRCNGIGTIPVEQNREVSNEQG